MPDGDEKVNELRANGLSHALSCFAFNKYTENVPPSERAF